MAYSSVSIILFLAIALNSCYGYNLRLDFHHRFSDKVREWTSSQGLAPTWDPEEVPRFSVEYYQRLVKYDLHRHRGRFLADGDLYAFARGNETVEYLGNLHYAFVDLGTPNQTFLVALDTGSDLFWVPCNCKKCAPTSDPSYGKVAFRNYEPSKSTTSKKIACSSNQCFTTAPSQCTNQSADCTYGFKYGSGSSAGTLVQDDLYLIKQDTTSKPIKLPILFGCGQNQTGGFLKGLAPNGLMGLGLTNISVPSMIANSGLNISDSFSMCFGLDGYGQLNFGDKGSADQNETTLNIDASPFYNISLTGFSIGGNASNLSFTTVVDSGTAYTRFTDDIHTELGTRFAAAVTEQPMQVEGIPFEYCFQLSANQTKIFLPPIYFTTKDGSTFRPRQGAIVLLVKKNSDILVGYCFGILPYNMNIIGENFLVGQRIVFDREKQILRWKPDNCSHSASPDSPAPAPPARAPPPPASDDAPPPPDLTLAPPPAKPNSAWSRPVGRSAVISVLASLISVTLVLWLPIV